MVENEQWASPGLEQVAELASGILPREFATLAEVPGSYRTLWPTPNAGQFNDGEDVASWQVRQARLRAKGINGNGMGTPLAMAAKMWPTPAARDFRDGKASPETMERNARPLNEVAVMLWPTPTSTDAKASGSVGYPASGTRQAGVTLTDAAVRGLLRPVTATDGPPSSTAGRVLNPVFVEMLMGWPPGWTDCASAETESCPTRRAAPSRSLEVA